MSQRLRSQQSGVVDIAPELYQKLRQEFLSSLTLETLNQALKLQLSGGDASADAAEGRAGNEHEAASGNL